MSDTLLDLYERLQATVPNGPVVHEADVDGWRLRMATSDFGDLMVSARTRRPGRIVGFEAGMKPGEWHPIYMGTRAEDLEWLRGLAARGDWRDTLGRR